MAAACKEPGCRDGWVWVDIDDDEVIRQRCPRCQMASRVRDANGDSCINPNDCCGGYCPDVDG